jgi:hypothetical protein
MTVVARCLVVAHHALRLQPRLAGNHVWLLGPITCVERGSHALTIRVVTVLALTCRQRSHGSMVQTVAREATGHRGALGALRTMREPRVATTASDQLVVAMAEDDLLSVVPRVRDIRMARITLFREDLAADVNSQ